MKILIFLVLAFLVWPFIAVAFVGGYGFVVWIYQMIAGPPVLAAGTTPCLESASIQPAATF